MSGLKTYVCTAGSICSTQSTSKTVTRAFGHMKTDGREFHTPTLRFDLQFWRIRNTSFICTEARISTAMSGHAEELKNWRTYFCAT
jgi:hypothetical protein